MSGGEIYAEMLATATEVLRSGGGGAALDRLEWEAEASADDPLWRTTCGALFEAQGRTLAITPALDSIWSCSYGLGGYKIAAVARPADQGVKALLFREEVELSRPVLVDRQGEGLVEVLGTLEPRLDSRPIEDELVMWVKGDLAAKPLVNESPMLEARRQTAHGLARVAVSHEILGASTALMDLAIDYVKKREQFNRPIGAFQSIQHLLADAEVQRSGLEAACRVVLNTFSSESHHGACLLKALAGRTGQKVAQATLQALGAIGFTWEHTHHRYFKRILVLDALFGSTSQIRPTLARTSSGQVWRAPAL